MWYTWTTLFLVSCTLVEAAEVGEVTTTETVPVATTRAPPRTLDRQASELVWTNWLQGSESGNQNAPPRRITTKSLFITPLVCPKGPRLDGNGCIQGITVNRDDHERILLEKLNALFPTAVNGDVLYDYGENEPGPLQLSIPIGLDPQAAPLHGQEPLAQAQEFQLNFIKKNGKPNGDASIEAELELLKLQNSQNNTPLLDGTGILNHNILTNFHYPEKPKRDSPLNITEIEDINNTTDKGQKEFVYGNVNVDPVLYNMEKEIQKTEQSEDQIVNKPQEKGNLTTTNSTTNDQDVHDLSIDTTTPDPLENSPKPISHVLKKDGDHSKLNPESDYSDIGEAIKLISRFAEVTTDDNFTKDQKKAALKEDSVLGTRTKIQYRRNKPKPEAVDSMKIPLSSEPAQDFKKLPTFSELVKDGVIYRYPVSNQQPPIPPPGYPFRHLQDYWLGQTKPGGVYNIHENPRRHHHSYSHNSRQHGHPYATYPGLQARFPELKRYIRRVSQHHAEPLRSRTNKQDLYSLLGLRHWFSSEGTAKR